MGSQLLPHSPPAEVGRISRISRSEVPARFHGDAIRAHLQMDLGMSSQKRGRHLNYGGFRDGDFQVFEKGRGQEFVDEHAVVLGIVAKLHHVPIAVIRLQQLCLGASSHSSHMPDGGKRHRKEKGIRG